MARKRAYDHTHTSVPRRVVRPALGTSTPSKGTPSAAVEGALHTAERAPHRLTTSAVLQLQRALGNQAVNRLLTGATWQPVQRAFDPATVALLEKHIGGKARQQEMISKDKQGQGMAEELVRAGRSDISASPGDPTKEQGVGISAALRRLVDFTKYDDASSVSVLAAAEQGGLSDDDKWNLVKVNSDFMTYIKDGMTINKIVPDSTVRNILEQGKMSAFGNSVGGSVAHKMNYDQGLTGEQAVSNFGLDYAGYTDTVGGKQVKLEGGKAVEQYGQWGGLSPYVKRIGMERSGRDTLEAVKNVFYVQLILKGQDIEKVRVPIHESIITFATEKKAEVAAALQDGSTLSSMAGELGGSEKEVAAMLRTKLEILDRFLKVALFSSSMAVSKKLSGAKNEDDPLTNLGMTKPGARMQNKFGTINEEYHLAGYVNMPAGSGLYLKDQTGKDTLVGQLVEKNGALAWSDLKGALIQARLRENQHFHRS